MSHGKGAKPSHPDKLARRKLATSHPLIAAVLAGTIAAAASLQQYEPPRKDQGQCGGCTAHSLSCGCSVATASVAAITNGASTALPFSPSPREIYAATRALERAAATPAGQLLPALTDSGAELADVLAAVGEYGVCPQAVAVTPDGRNSDVWTAADTTAQPANVNAEPAVAQLEQAATYLVAGAYGITIDSTTSAVCAAAIQAGFPIYVGFFCDSGFEAWKKGDAPYGAPNQNDPNGGGHAVFIDGFTTNADGTRTWRLVNSWGESWGDDGACLVSDAFLLACWELHVLQVTVSSQPVGKAVA